MACWVEPCWAVAIELITPKASVAAAIVQKTHRMKSSLYHRSHESPPDSDENASTISIGSDLANLGLWSARSHRMRRAALLRPAALAPRAATRKRPAEQLDELASPHGSLSPRITPYHIVLGMPRCASQQNWLPMTGWGQNRQCSGRAQDFRFA